MKPYTIKINSFADSDLKMAADWYAAQKEGLDKDFIEEIENTLHRIQRNPQHFAFVRKKIRMSIVKRFPYGIYFYVSEDVINVFAVFHFSRSPKIIGKRLKPIRKKK
jgi:plasmid stabilization system protein ParE